MSIHEDELQLEIEELKKERDAYKSQRDQLHRDNIDLRIRALEERGDDHETRIRAVEQTASRSNVLYALSTGGGALGVIVLIRALITTP